MSLRYDFAGRDRFHEIFEVFGADGEKQLEIRGRWIRAS